MASARKTIVIACAVLQEEIELIKPVTGRIIYLPQGLHRTPQVLAASVQKEMDAIEPGSVDTVLMAYGLCSNGIVGVKAMRGEIIIPRVHDCIGIFLKRIALIHIGKTISESTRMRACENARYFGMSYEEIRGSDRLLRKLFRKERTDEFVIVTPGESIKPEPFISQ